MWDAYVAASNGGAASSAQLATYADGAALEALNDGLARNKALGLVTRGVPRLSPTVTSAAPADAPTTVTVGDCVDDSDWLQYRPDGQLADTKPGGRRSARATVTRGAGVWKVASFGVQAVGTC
jgi:hypothetical protein